MFNQRIALKFKWISFCSIHSKCNWGGDQGIDTWHTTFEKKGLLPYFPVSRSAADSWNSHTDLKIEDIYCT